MAKELPEHLTYEEIEVKRWFVKGEFNPASPDHIIKYMEAVDLRSRPSKHSKTGKPSTDEATLTRFAKKDALFRYILQWRKLEKMKGTYVNSVLGLLDDNDRLHPQFPHNPSTWRLSSTEPNFQNIPQPGDEDGPESLQKQFRQAIVARPQCTLVSADFSGIEAVLTGWYAGDKDYMRLATIGIHAYLTSHKVGEPADLSWDNAKLSAHLADIKRRFHDSDIYYALKRTVHLCLSPDHEVLTPQGWKRLDELSYRDEIAQWHPNSTLSFVNPQLVHMPNDSGKLHLLAGRGIQLAATPGHRTPVFLDNDGPLHTFPVEALPANGRIPINGILDGSVSWSPTVALAVAIQADASLNGTHARFHLHKQRKIDRLQDILGQLKIHYSYRECRCGGCYISFNYKDRRWLSQTKDFSWDLLNLTQEAKLAFLEELLQWDGSEYRKGSTVRRVYCNTNLHNCVVAQTIAHCCGKQALLRSHPVPPNCSPAWVVSFNRRKRVRVFRLQQLETSSNETVWCVTVPSSWFLVRYKGAISVTGNTNYGGSPAMMNLAAPEAFPSINAAQEMQEFYLKLCPKLKQWHEALRRRAAKENYLGGNDHPYHFKHWFWDVLKFDMRSEKWIAGSDWNRVVAFYPQSTAAGILFDTVLDLTDKAGENYIGDLYFGATPLRALIHDEILAEVETQHLQQFVDKLRRSMQSFRFDGFTPPGVTDPLPLVIGADVKVGPNWGEMEKAA